MRSFQDTFQTRKQSFISAFSVCMTVPLVWVYLSFIEYTIYIMETFNFKNFKKTISVNTLGTLNFVDPLNSELSEVTRNIY